MSTNIFYFNSLICYFDMTDEWQKLDEDVKMMASDLSGKNNILIKIG
jgi:hypothetical protein